MKSEDSIAVTGTFMLRYKNRILTIHGTVLNEFHRLAESQDNITL